MNDIEAFRKQLLASTDNSHSIDKSELIQQDLQIAYAALDRLTDSLGEMVCDTDDSDLMVYYAQLRGELCSYFNGISMLLEDYNSDSSLPEWNKLSY